MKNAFRAQACAVLVGAALLVAGCGDSDPVAATAPEQTATMTSNTDAAADQLRVAQRIQDRLGRLADLSQETSRQAAAGDSAAACEKVGRMGALIEANRRDLDRLEQMPSTPQLQDALDGVISAIETIEEGYAGLEAYC